MPKSLKNRELAPMEREVLILAARGLTAKETAVKLRLRAHTVQDHRRFAYKRLGASGCVDALLKGKFLVPGPAMAETGAGGL